MRSRKKLTFYNTLFNLLQQLAAAICGLIVPRLIIGHYGSSVNGTISSISQFLSYITFLEAGVGAVVNSALYKPLAKKDHHALSCVVVATERYFRTIARLFLIYIAIVAVFFPFVVADQFSWWFSFSMVIIISISTFAQYYFGLTYQLVIQSDQKLYLTSLVQIVTLFLNTVVVLICVSLNVQIHLLKLISATVYVLRPLFYNYYVKRHYQIDKTVEPDKDTIRQKWDGLGQHIAYVIHANTDVTVLTLFANVKIVSVYSVYHSVIYGIVNVVNSFTNGIYASIGNLIANDEEEKLKDTFDLYETLNFILITIFFTTTGIMLLPFVRIYTAGVTDVNYERPLFAVLLVLAEAAYCMRNPYSTVILSAGHFRQTNQICYLEAAVNIILSVILVYKFGIVGVAVGTLCAMLLRTFHHVYYLSKRILYRSIWKFVKGFSLCILCVLIITAIVHFCFPVQANNYLVWVLYAVPVFALSAAVTLGVYYIAYPSMIKRILGIFRNLFHK
ncbi:MAG: polysaccharide biosynthesis C-terminal domain-containing protein [Fusicatenibacter sp.]|nr:polysaccharide biosynthesis C-terminal domain-containing protein [Lachnospiraceae bacterium]MDY2937498.1 polysaccharide biosynthesis C-terminal domain-containing protein [Fusicatenibacter sp.]